MLKQGRVITGIALLCALLSGCLGSVWTGASMVYDRHNVYKKLNDYHLLTEVNTALYKDKLLKQKKCALDVAAFNGDILIAGHVPSQELMDELQKRLSHVTGYRRLFNETSVSTMESNSIQDSWITAKIRSQIFADDSIDPKVFKIITSDRIVYLMGDVKKREANKVIEIARYTEGVARVVKALNYFTYETPKNSA